MDRLPEIDLNALAPDQQRVHDKILNGPRGRVAGPFERLLHRPGLGDRLQEFGAYIRFESALPDDLRELAICTTAANWGVQYEWHAHTPQALKFGIAHDTLAAIGRGETPALDGMPSLVYRLCKALLKDADLPDALYTEAMETLGKEQTMDLVGLVGYYSALGMCINTFGVRPPADTDPPLA